MNNLLGILRCPSCGGTLSGKSTVRCHSCNTQYSVSDGVINFLDEHVFEDTHNEHQKKYYDKEYVDAYANTQFEWRNRYIQRIRPYLPKNRSSVIVDVACGQGYISIALAEMGYSVIASDLSIEGLKRARAVAKSKRLTDRILFVASDVTKLRLKKVSVSAVILLHIIEHLKQDKKVIQQLMAFCKKGGVFVIGVPLSYRYIFPLFIPMYYSSDLRVGHYRHYALEDLSRLFGSAARVLHVYYTGHVIKLIGAVFSLFRITSFEKVIEDMDERHIDNKLWASNIMAIFKKI